MFRCTSDLKLQLTRSVHAMKQHEANVPNQHIRGIGHGDAMGRAAGAPAACGLAATADAGRWYPLIALVRSSSCFAATAAYMS
jgi:hypothetical protein